MAPKGPDEGAMYRVPSFNDGGATPAAGQGVALRGEVLSQRWEVPKGSPGDAADGHFVPIGPPPYPLCRFATSPPDRGSEAPDPYYGGYPLDQAESFRRAKSEWQSKFPPGHWALSLQKFRTSAAPHLRLALTSQQYQFG